MNVRRNSPKVVAWQSSITRISKRTNVKNTPSCARIDEGMTQTKTWLSSVFLLLFYKSLFNNNKCRVHAIVYSTYNNHMDSMPLVRARLTVLQISFIWSCISLCIWLFYSSLYKGSYGGLIWMPLLQDSFIGPSCAWLSQSSCVTQNQTNLPSEECIPAHVDLGRISFVVFKPIQIRPGMNECLRTSEGFLWLVSLIVLVYSVLLQLYAS